MGAKGKGAAGSCTPDRPRDYRSGHGGQASSPGTFGLPYPGVRKWTAPAAQAKAESPSAQSQASAPAQPAQAPTAKPFSCRPPRFHVRGLSYGKYKVLEQAASVSAPIPEPAPTPAPAPALTVNLERERFALFERIAARENRPVKTVIAECLNGCAIQVARIEAQNIRLAAVASDERTRRGLDEDAELERRSAGAGYVDVCLALD